MATLRRFGWLMVFLAWGATAMAAGDEGIFRDLSLDKARQAASDGGKRLVLVDFYTTWCVPCRKLDETTWKDQGVRDWLAREAVCLKVDAEKDEALAEKYRINVYPTVLLLRPDGSEVDRLVGYRDAKAFLADAAEALAGNDSLSRARKKLEGANANDPMLRMSYGDALVQKGRPDDALSEYLWCFDHGLEHGPGFTGVRLSFLLNNIVQLGRTHPAAIEELRKRREAARKAIEAGKADFGTAMGFTSLNSYLKEPEQTLALYERVKGEKALDPSIKSFLADQALDLLLQAKRYKEIVADTDPLAKLRRVVSQYEQTKDLIKDDPRIGEMMKRQAVVNGAKYYEASLGSGDQAKASEVAAILAGFDAAQAYPLMIAAARRVGDVKATETLTRQAEKVSKP